MGLVTVAWH